MSDLVIVSRAQWHARGAPPRLMPLPARELWLHHSATAVSSDAAADMRQVESIGLQRFGRISYSWCFHPNGTVLEGAGLRVGAHTARRNSTSFGLCLIGDYSRRDPTTAQVDGVRRVIAQLIATGSLHPGVYPTGGHRDLKVTACPGDKAYAALAAFRVPWRQEDDDDMSSPVDGLQDPHGGVWVLSADGVVRNYRGARHLGDFAGLPPEARQGSHTFREMAYNARGGYDLLDEHGHIYSFPVG